MKKYLKMYSYNRVSFVAMLFLLFASTNLYSQNRQAEDNLFSIAGVDINSGAREFGGYKIEDKIYYCSSKGTEEWLNRIDYASGESFISMYSVNLESEKKNSIRLKERFKKGHFGPICSSIDSNFVYVTMDSKTKAEDKHRRLKIYKASLNKKGFLKDFIELSINDDSFSTGHPTITPDGKYLIYASDRPGGFGGVDLYKSEIKPDGSLGIPVNLGNKVNTNENELFPWVDESENLFFSSAGHDGFGSLDVYVAFKDDDNYTEVLNLGSSINSSSDDFAFILNDDQKTGFVSSNRTSGKGNDDIYSFVLLGELKPVYSLNGLITDRYSGEVLPGTLVKLFDKDLVLVDSVLSDESGAYNFIVEPDREYQIKSMKSDYFEQVTMLHTFGLESGQSKEFDVELEKDPGVALEFIVFERDNENKVLDSVSYSIIDNISGEKVGTFLTGSDSRFLFPLENKRINDRISYNVVISKDGYLSSKQTFNYEITQEGLISVRDVLDIDLVKVDQGVDVGKLLNLNPIYFDLGKSSIRPDAAVELDKIVKIMNDNPEMVIELGAHTDSRGSSSSNMKLSDRRAKSSANYIKEKISNPERISGKGYGESVLLNNCSDGVRCSEEEHAINRRTEFLIVKVK